MPIAATMLARKLMTSRALPTNATQYEKWFLMAFQLGMSMPEMWRTQNRVWKN
jgi:hypothetical protein